MPTARQDKAEPDRQRGHYRRSTDAATAPWSWTRRGPRRFVFSNDVSGGSRNLYHKTVRGHREVVLDAAYAAHPLRAIRKRSRAAGASLSHATEDRDKAIAEALRGLANEAQVIGIADAKQRPERTRITP